MPNIFIPCTFCGHQDSRLSSPLPGVEIKLGFWCSSCKALNGVVYRWKNQKEYEVLKDFKVSSVPTIPTVELDIEPKLDNEEEVPL